MVSRKGVAMLDHVVMNEIYEIKHNQRLVFKSKSCLLEISIHLFYLYL